MSLQSKSMQDEMSDEWLDLAVQNIHKLIPQSWMPQINEILPKLLKIVKIAMKKNIKTSAEQLGNTKIMLMLNVPNELSDGSTIMVPTCYRIDKSQLGPSVLDEATGIWELQLKPDSVPEYEFSMLTFIQKLDKYDKIEDLIKDLKNGNFMSLEDIKYTGDHSNTGNNTLEQPGTKQIAAPETTNSQTPNP